MPTKYDPFDEALRCSEQRILMVSVMCVRLDVGGGRSLPRGTHSVFWTPPGDVSVPLNVFTARHVVCDAVGRSASVPAG